MAILSRNRPGVLGRLVGLVCLGALGASSPALAAGAFLDAVLASVAGKTVTVTDVAIGRALSLFGLRPSEAPIGRADVESLANAVLMEREAAQLAIGDTAALAAPVPGIAPAAKQMGKYVGRLIAARIAGGGAPAPFVYKHAGDLATVGRKSAVVKLNRVKLTGFIGWLFWSIAHIYFLIGIRNRLVVAMTWLWSYITYQRGARLITRDDRPG
jgi:NADH dehydrogenase